MFAKAGDWVVCTDNRTAEDELTEQKFYHLTQDMCDSIDWVYVIADHGAERSFRADRFNFSVVPSQSMEDATTINEGDVVECVLPYEQSTGWLTVGKHYKVDIYNDNTIVVVGDNGIGGGFRRKHFRKVTPGDTPQDAVTIDVEIYNSKNRIAQLERLRDDAAALGYRLVKD